MATVHATQALFLAKHMIPYAIGLGFFIVSSELCTTYMCAYAYPLIDAFKAIGH